MLGILCLGAVLATATVLPPVDGDPAIEPVAPGTRVRLTFARNADPLAPGHKGSGPRREGKIIDVGDRTLTMAFDGYPGPIEVETTSVLRLERSLGRRPRGKAALRGAGIGLLAGVTSGVLLGFASGDDRCPHPEDPRSVNCFFFFGFSAGDKAAMYGIALGTLGTIGGAVVGAARSGERWERGATVFANERVGVRVLPAGRGGAGISVSVGF